ncbi:phytanoyl-CoA dioxygenase family protein [Actinopolymorpha sp. B9G3]|uniref:phytanoyl-CoA dioxygenase family protein n=1 Tax=Actinopolymorpha sp. B9G3 TaxID=3158970 RepID=UPI0032D95BE4
MDDNQRRHFWKENGYLVLEEVFSPAEVESLRGSADRLSARAEGLTQSTDRFILHTFGDGGGAPIVQQIAEPHELGGEWMALARDPRILDTVEMLIGPNIQLYYSMMMMKPARQGSRAPWHQDFAFFVHDRASLVACQVYLDDSTLENGCVRVVPGSHRDGLLNHFHGDEFTEMVQGDTAEFDAREVALPVKAGGVAFWHCMTLHSSHPNTSAFPRRAIVFEYKDANARLLKGSFSASEVRAAGMMLRGKDPRADLLSAL